MKPKRGPKDGYSSDEKQEYRKNVWNMLLSCGVHDGDYLCMPSASGEEIGVMISMGINEDQIIAVDESAALIATAKWRATYPKVRCYGSKLSRASERMNADGINLVSANLDLCNNISEELVTEVNTFLRHCRPRKQFAVTITRARESTALLTMINSTSRNPNLDARTNAFIHLVDMPDPGYAYIGGEKYLHSKHPMQWFVFGIKPYAATDEIKECLLRINKADQRKCDLYDEVLDFKKSEWYMNNCFHGNKHHKDWLKKREELRGLDKEYHKQEDIIDSEGCLLTNMVERHLQRENYLRIFVRMYLSKITSQMGLPHRLQSAGLHKNLATLLR